MLTPSRSQMVRPALWTLPGAAARAVRLHTVPGADCAGAHSSKTLASGTATLLT
jgi:hypothetical protein